MTFEYIRTSYGVPAKRGARVEYTGSGKPQLATVVSAEGQYVNLRFDGATQTIGPFHPTWEMRYLDGDAP